MQEDQSLSTLPDITETTAATASTTQPSTNGKDNETVRPRKRKAEKNLTISQFTITTPTHAYVHLQHLTPTSLPETPSSFSSLDATTALLDIRASLSQFLGMHGTAIPIDVLKLQGRDVWIRIPSDDRHALIAAVGGWMGKNGQGWRVKGWSSWSVGSCNNESSCQSLFTDG
ncbi:hypothetical protein K431DRAFT_59086 [Polychaeton citri CBS 116435]|uniref:Ribonucleases P/MRP subunit Pop8-like domain-containing protein n=1 Tax=Polychaeton citri CBS 116435 TaxID=1314669 RepID=A0A9P4Q9G2_9PEZI|nr:hypothetical protein K431DRAFT_59086 [Polychaeton citri CBS 116435]